MQSSILAVQQKGPWIGVAIWLSLAPLALAEDLVELIAKVEHAVVRIDTVDSEGGGTGSGVIVDDRGGILTNFHVINGATEAVVTLRNGKLLKAMGYIAIDSSHDLALIKTIKFDEPSAIKIADEMPKAGERVAAFGNPRGFSFSTSEGIVSSIRKGTDIIETIGREAYSLLGYATDATWIQTTAPISPGNSGGPLVTMKGELVGLNTWNQTAARTSTLRSVSSIFGGCWKASRTTLLRITLPKCQNIEESRSRQLLLDLVVPRNSSLSFRQDECLPIPSSTSL